MMIRVAQIAIVMTAWAIAPVMGLEGRRDAFEPVRQIGSRNLPLRGVGRLRRWMITGCDIALYAKNDATADTLLDGSALALEFHYHVRIRNHQFSRAALETLQRQFPSDQFERYAAEIARFHAAYADVGRDDRYLLAFAPGEGLTLFLNGTPRVTVATEGFGPFYLSVWLGPDPIDRALYDGLTATIRKGAR